MNKLVLLAIFSFVLISCKSQREAQKEGKLKVGLVFDVGGRGDKSFNDSAYEGLVRARDSLGITFQYIEPSGTGGGDREAGLRELAAKGFKLIFGVGFMFTDDITKIAREFPNTHFACIDYAVKENEPIPQNLLAIKFKEEEGSFLVGVISGLMTKTNRVGFVGGMDIPLIHKFEAGYRAGVLSVNPSCKVLVGYAGLTGEAFKNPGKGKELALSQYNQGADIIFHASGSTGLGVFEAAREKNK
ncbi:MAG: BMP family lipoprotein, partial [bacterium]